MRNPINTISGPEPLVAAIKAVSATWNPSQARPEYEANKATWQLYLDLLELDETRLQAMIERHGTATDEPDAKLAVRQRLAVVFNLVPTVVNMFTGYIFSEEPQIDVKGDKHLEAFLADCTGGGVKLVDWLRLKALPYAVGMGSLDTLVQNPAAVVAAEKDSIKPAVYAITPLHKISWAARNAGGLHWLTFRDFGNEDENPFTSNPILAEGYITISAARPDAAAPFKTEAGFWIRSTPGVLAREAGGTSPVWDVVADFTPTARCAVATLFYRESLDPQRKNSGVSKLGTIAVLTRAIINVLSWAQEDMLANLALLALPSKGGKAPTDADGNAITPTLSPATIVYYDPIAAGAIPQWVQGDADHIRLKMEFVGALVNEILRQANLLGVSGDVKSVKSGVQGWVMRSELFQELSTVATGMDNFIIDLLALAKSWATGQDWTRERLLDEIGPTVNCHKGPYAIDPLETVIQNAAEVVRMFGRVSPLMAESALAYVARSFLFADDPALPDILKEIKANTGGVLETITEQMDALAVDIQARNDVSPTTPPTKPANAKGPAAAGGS